MGAPTGGAPIKISSDVCRYNILYFILSNRLTISMIQDTSTTETSIFESLPDFGQEAVRKLYLFAETMQKKPPTSLGRRKTPPLEQDNLTLAGAAAGFARIFAHFSRECSPKQNSLKNGNYTYDTYTGALHPIYNPSYRPRNKKAFVEYNNPYVYHGLPFSYTEDKDLYWQDVQVLHRAFAEYTEKKMSDLFGRAVDILLEHLPALVKILINEDRRARRDRSFDFQAVDAAYICLHLAALEQGMPLYMIDDYVRFRDKPDMAIHMAYVLCNTCILGPYWYKPLVSELAGVNFDTRHFQSKEKEYAESFKEFDSALAKYHLLSETFEKEGRLFRNFSGTDIAWLEKERDRFFHSSQEKSDASLLRQTAFFPLTMRLNFKKALESAPPAIFDSEEHRQRLIDYVLSSEKGFCFHTLGDIMLSCIPLSRRPFEHAPTRLSFSKPGLMSHSDHEDVRQFFDGLYPPVRPEPSPGNPKLSNIHKVPLFWYEPFQYLGFLSGDAEKHAQNFEHAVQTNLKSYGGSIIPSLHANSLPNGLSSLYRDSKKTFYSFDSKNAIHRLGFLWTPAVLEKLVSGYPAKKRGTPSLYATLYGGFWHPPKTVKLPSSVKIDSSAATDKNRITQAAEMAALSVMDAAAAWKLPVEFFTRHADAPLRESPLFQVTERKDIIAHNSPFYSYGEEIGNEFLQGILVDSLSPILFKHMTYKQGPDRQKGWFMELGGGVEVFFTQNGRAHSVLDTVAQLWECASYPDLLRNLFPALKDDGTVSDFLFENVVTPTVQRFRAAPSGSSHIYTPSLYLWRHKAAEKAYACLKDIFTAYPHAVYLASALYPLHNMPLSGPLPELVGEGNSIRMQPQRLPCLPRYSEASFQGFRELFAKKYSRRLSESVSMANQAWLVDAVFSVLPALKTRHTPDTLKGFITPVQKALSKGAEASMRLGALYRLNVQQNRPEHALLYHASLKNWELPFFTTDTDPEELIGKVSGQIQRCLAEQYHLLSEKMADIFGNGRNVFDSAKLSEVLLPCFASNDAIFNSPRISRINSHLDKVLKKDVCLARRVAFLRTEDVSPGSLFLELFEQEDLLPPLSQWQTYPDCPDKPIGVTSSFAEPSLHANVLQHLVFEGAEEDRTAALFEHRNRFGCLYADSALRMAVRDQIAFDLFLQEVLPKLKVLQDETKMQIASWTGADSEAYLRSATLLEKASPSSIGMTLLGYAAANEPSLVFETEDRLVKKWNRLLVGGEAFRYLNPEDANMASGFPCDILCPEYSGEQTGFANDKSPSKETICFHLQRAVLAGFADTPSESEADFRLRGLLAINTVRLHVKDTPFRYNFEPVTQLYHAEYMKGYCYELFAYTNARKMYAMGLNNSIFNRTPSTFFDLHGEKCAEHTDASLTVRDHLADFIERAVYEAVGKDISSEWAAKWDSVLPSLVRVTDTFLDGTASAWQGAPFSRYFRAPVLFDTSIPSGLRMSGDFVPVGIGLPYTFEIAENLTATLNEPASFMKYSETVIHRMEGEPTVWIEGAGQISARPRDKSLDVEQQIVTSPSSSPT